MNKRRFLLFLLVLCGSLNIFSLELKDKENYIEATRCILKLIPTRPSFDLENEIDLVLTFLDRLRVENNFEKLLSDCQSSLTFFQNKENYYPAFNKKDFKELKHWGIYTKIKSVQHDPVSYAFLSELIQGKALCAMTMPAHASLSFGAILGVRIKGPSFSSVYCYDKNLSMEYKVSSSLGVSALFGLGAGIVAGTGNGQLWSIHPDKKNFVSSTVGMLLGLMLGIGMYEEGSNHHLNKNGDEGLFGIMFAAPWVSYGFNLYHTKKRVIDLKNEKTINNLIWIFRSSHLLPQTTDKLYQREIKKGSV